LILISRKGSNRFNGDPTFHGDALEQLLIIAVEIGGFADLAFFVIGEQPLDLALNEVLLVVVRSHRRERTSVPESIRHQDGCAGPELVHSFQGSEPL
jgi:hypothetical protein